MGEVGVHLEHQAGAARRAPRGSRRCRRGRGLPCCGRCRTRDARVARRRAGRRSRRCRRASCRRRPGSGLDAAASRSTASTKASMFAGLVVGGQRRARLDPAPRDWGIAGMLLANLSGSDSYRRDSRVAPALGPAAPRHDAGGRSAASTIRPTSPPTPVRRAACRRRAQGHDPAGPKRRRHKFADLSAKVGCLAATGARTDVDRPLPRLRHSDGRLTSTTGAASERENPRRRMLTALPRPPER